MYLLCFHGAMMCTDKLVSDPWNAPTQTTGTARGYTLYILFIHTEHRYHTLSIDVIQQLLTLDTMLLQ